jgi:hypothetical protein
MALQRIVAVLAHGRKRDPGAEKKKMVRPDRCLNFHNIIAPGISRVATWRGLHLRLIVVAKKRRCAPLPEVAN